MRTPGFHWHGAIAFPAPVGGPFCKALTLSQRHIDCSRILTRKQGSPIKVTNIVAGSEQIPAPMQIQPGARL
jgi:hypothetical protein